MQLTDNINNQIIEVWKTNDRTINIQPTTINLDVDFCEKNIIPEIALKFGSVQEKKDLIKKLQNQIKTIEMCISAMNNDYVLNIIKVGECPF